MRHTIRHWLAHRYLLLSLGLHAGHEGKRHCDHQWHTLAPNWFLYQALLGVSVSDKAKLKHFIDWWPTLTKVVFDYLISIFDRLGHSWYSTATTAQNVEKVKFMVSATSAFI